MNLIHEAGYLYILSKELVSLNKKLKKLTAKAEKQVHKHAQAKTDDERYHHRVKHARTTIEITHLLKKHNGIIDQLRYHHIAFQSILRKEQKI